MELTCMFLSSLLFPSARLYCWELLQYCLHFQLPTMVRKVRYCKVQIKVHCISIYIVHYFGPNCLYISCTQNTQSSVSCVYIIPYLCKAFDLHAYYKYFIYTIKIFLSVQFDNTAHCATHNIERLHNTCSVSHMLTLTSMILPTCLLC